jgi:hypothetical protein
MAERWTPTSTKHTCENLGAFGRLVKGCPRCDELMAAAGQTAIEEAAAVLAEVLPIGPQSIDIGPEEFQNHICVKERLENENGEVAVRFRYKGRIYLGCIGWWNPVVSGADGSVTGKQLMYTLFPTVAERDETRPKIEEYSRMVEQRIEVQRREASSMSWNVVAAR